MQRRSTDNSTSTIHQDPPLLERLFASTEWSGIWVIPRLYVGWVWLSIGWAMLQSQEWMAHGTALRSAMASGIASSWTNDQPATGFSLMPHLVESEVLTWIARLTAIGMTLAGIALVLGVATGAAAFAGLVLSVNVMMAGSVAPGPEIVALAVLLVMAWKTAGWLGLDRWLLPLAGAPWPGGFATAEGIEPANPPRSSIEVPH